MSSKTYIVTLNEDADEPAVASFKGNVQSLGGTVEHEYSLIKGYVISVPETTDIKTLDADENVKSVEEDSTVKANSA